MSACECQQTLIDDLANVTQRGANVFHVRDDKVTPLMVYFNRERALADLDLKQ